MGMGGGWDGMGIGGGGGIGCGDESTKIMGRGEIYTHCLVFSV